MTREKVDPDQAMAAAKRDRLPGYLWEQRRQEVLERDENRCVQCGADATDVDHVLPVALGGDDEVENLQSLCSDCHKRKTVQDNEMSRRMRKMRKYQNRIAGFD